MNIVLPIIGMALLVGVLPRRMTPGLWVLMVIWILLHVLFRLFKS